MQRITREQARKYAFDWRDEPLLRVKPGETFEIETYDASTGYFRTPEDLAIPAKRPGFDRVPPLANPIGGPVWVEGAERGDTLVVSVEDILVDGYSWVAVGPRRGPLGESARWPELSERLHDQDLPPHPRSERDDPRRHAPLQRPDQLADHAVHRHHRGRARARGDDQPRRPGRVGRQSRHPRRRAGKPDPPPGLPRGRALLPGRRARQPGRHRVHGDGGRDQVHRASPLRPGQGPDGALDADREAGVDRLRLRLPAARGRRRDRHDQPDRLAGHATTATPRPTRTASSAPARTSASTCIRCARSGG